MTWRQWLRHLRMWLWRFPFKGGDHHSWVSSLGEPDEECLVCEAQRLDPDWTPADREQAQEFYRQNPHLRGDPVGCARCGANLAVGVVACPECGNEVTCG